MASSSMLIGLMLMPILSLGRILLGIFLFCAPLPPREPAWLRMTAAFGALLAIYVAVSAATMWPAASVGGAWFYHAQFVTYSLLLLACVGVFVRTYDASIWTALFCCSAGYTVQNLASGLTELVWSLFGGGAPLTSDFFTPGRIGLSLCCTAIVYAPCFATITRRLTKDALTRIQDRTMLVMMALTILVIIGFDLLVKSLVDQGVPTATMVLLRIFHGLACLFTLTTEYQLLIARRLESERDAAWQVLAERERQYEASRRNVEAINARVHDIRHAIGRLVDDAHVDHATLAEIVREVDVYGTTLRTGHAALDTVLAEKGLACQRAGVALSCVADASALAFMAPGDVYALFSSLLDVALALTQTLATGRSISVNVRDVLGSTAVHVECTTSAHEGGLDSLEALCERYGGTFTVRTEEGAWQANMLFPQAE